MSLWPVSKIEPSLIEYISTIASHVAYERCGLVFGDGSWACVDNVAVDKKHAFAMNIDRQMQLIMDHGYPIATWHTHPGGLFDLSETDRRELDPDTALMIGVPDGRVGIWIKHRLESTWLPRSQGMSAAGGIEFERH